MKRDYHFTVLLFTVITTTCLIFMSCSPSLNPGNRQGSRIGGGVETEDIRGSRGTFLQVEGTHTLNASWSASCHDDWHPQAMCWDPVDEVLVLSLQGNRRLLKVATDGTLAGTCYYPSFFQTGIACNGTHYFIADYRNGENEGPIYRNDRGGDNVKLASMHWQGGAPMTSARGYLYFGDPVQSAGDWSGINRLVKTSSNNPTVVLGTINTSIPGIGDMTFDGRDLWILEYTDAKNGYATLHCIGFDGEGKETFRDIYRAGADHVPCGLAYGDGALYLFSYSEKNGCGSTITKISLARSPYAEEIECDGMTEDRKICYAREKPFNISVKVNATGGPDGVSNIKLHLDHNDTDIILSYDWQEDEFGKLGDEPGHVELLTDLCRVENGGDGFSQVTFSIHFDFSFPHERQIDCFVNTTSVSGKYSMDHFENICRVENDLELTGIPSIRGEYQGKVEPGSWIRGNETLRITGLAVCYQGDPGLHPEDDFYTIRVEDGGQGEWFFENTDGTNVTLEVVTRNRTIPGEEYRITIQDVPGLGAGISVVVIPVSIDATPPSVPEELSCHAASYEDTATQFTHRSMTYLTWNDVIDEGSGLAGYIYGRSNGSDIDDGSFTNRTRSSLSDLEEGYAGVYVRAVDNVGNVGSTALSGIEVDLQAPIFSNFTPADGSWQNHGEFECSVKIADNGSGVDLGSIEYSISCEGAGLFGIWKKAMVRENDSIIVARARAVFNETDNNYIIWRCKDLADNEYAESDPINIRVDSTRINFGSDVYPSSDWYRHRKITTRIYASDNGSGVDSGSIEVKIKGQHSPVYGEWMKVESNNVTLGENGVSEISFLFTYEEGARNYIMFRGCDVAGNAYSDSIAFNMKVDENRVFFGEMWPKPDNYSNHKTVDCFITIMDNGSGVDPDTIEYSYSTIGREDSDFGPWTKPTRIIGGNPMQAIAGIELDWGRNNFIRWRGNDRVKSGYSISSPASVWVNSRPIIIFSSPKEKVQYYSDKNIIFDATDSNDADNDNLTFAWYTDRNSNATIGNTSSFEAKLAGGRHVITLVISDGHGYEVRENMTIDVKPVSDEKGGSSGGFLRSGVGILGVDIVYIILFLLVIGAVAGIFFFVKRRKKERTKMEKEEAEKKKAEEETPEDTEEADTETEQDVESHEDEPGKGGSKGEEKGVEKERGTGTGKGKRKVVSKDRTEAGEKADKDTEVTESRPVAGKARKKKEKKTKVKKPRVKRTVIARKKEPKSEPSEKLAPGTERSVPLLPE